MKEMLRQFVVFTLFFLVAFVGVRIFLDVVIDGLSIADINMVRLIITTAIGAVVVGILYVLVFFVMNKLGKKK